MQQSPAFGRSMALQASHSKKTKQALLGIISRFACPQIGQVKTDSRMSSGTTSLI